MKIWALFKEAFFKYMKEGFTALMKRGWRRNVFLVPFLLAVIVLLIIIINSL